MRGALVAFAVLFNTLTYEPAPGPPGDMAALPGMPTQLVATAPTSTAFRLDETSSSNSARGKTGTNHNFDFTKMFADGQDGWCGYLEQLQHERRHARRSASVRRPHSFRSLRADLKHTHSTQSTHRRGAEPRARDGRRRAAAARARASPASRSSRTRAHPELQVLRTKNHLTQTHDSCNNSRQCHHSHTLCNGLVHAAAGWWSHGWSAPRLSRTGRRRRWRPGSCGCRSCRTGRSCWPGRRRACRRARLPCRPCAAARWRS